MVKRIIILLVLMIFVDVLGVMAGIDTASVINRVDSLVNEADTLNYSSATFSNSDLSKNKRMSQLSWREYVMSGFNDEDKFIRFSYRLIILLALVFLLIFLFIITNRLWVEFFKRKKRKINDRIEELIASYITSDHENESSDTEAIVEELHRMQKSPTARRIILKYLLLIDMSFKGESIAYLRKLYVALNFHKRALKKLKSESWAKRAKVIRELAQMDRVEAKEEIAKSLNHISPVLRLEAGIALLKLDKENPFAFLDVDRELTHWQQINLMDIIRNAKTIAVPSFKKWLNSKQASIVEFSVRLIAYYQQMDAVDDLVRLLKHPQPSVRLEVVKCLGVLEIEEAVSALILQMETEQNADVRLQCIKSIGYLNVDASFGFLEIMVSVGNVDESLAAAIALRNTGASGITLLKSKLELNNEIAVRSIKHALDDNLVLS